MQAQDKGHHQYHHTAKLKTPLWVSSYAVEHFKNLTAKHSIPGINDYYLCSKYPKASIYEFKTWRAARTWLNREQEEKETSQMRHMGSLGLFVKVTPDPNQLHKPIMIRIVRWFGGEQLVVEDAQEEQ